MQNEGEKGTRRNCVALAVPKGPHGERRPADAIGCAVHVAKIATGETQDTAYKATEQGTCRSSWRACACGVSDV